MNKKSESIKIEGMSCNHCVSSVNKALSATEGVNVKNVEIGKAEVTYDSDKVTHEQLVTAIEDIGFEVVN